jgi:hypothetical protein
MEEKSQGLASIVRPHGGHAPTLFQATMPDERDPFTPNPSPYQITALEAGFPPPLADG